MAGTTVDVANASGITGAAAAAAQNLTRAGFTPAAANEPGPAHTATTVTYPTGGQAAAAAAARALAIPVTLHANDALPAGHLRIVLGTDYHPDPAAGPATTGAPPADPTGPPVTAGGVPCVD